MKKLLLATAAFGALAFPALAADMASAPVYKAPPPISVCNWCGFYVGATAGGAWNDNDPVNVVTTNSFNAGPPLSNAQGMTNGPASAAATTANIGASRVGFTGGVEAGYNWQLGNAVAGFETDIQAITGKSSATVTQVVPRVGFPGLNYTGTVAVSSKVDYVGTVRGRLGFLVAPTLLLYGTGGLAYGGTSSSTAITGAETPAVQTNDIAGTGATSGARVGWTGGAGLEWLFMSHWTLKAEWLHYDLGSVTYSNGTMNGIVAASSPLFAGLVRFTDVSTSSVRFSGDLVRAGVNYKF